MDKKRLQILGLSQSHSQSGSFALVLGEEAGTKRLPIIIGMFEAQAIALEIEKIKSGRPMTHDLFKTFADSFEVEVHEVIISSLREGVFFAKLICSFADGTNFTEMDARPSDAIAIAVRFNAPIYAYNSVLNEAGIMMSDIEQEEAGITPNPTEIATASQSEATPTRLKDVSTDKLQGLMQEAIEDEDYERAAKIRDELERRQS
ncbi:MAG: bifunctional DNase/RNase [Arenicella sp.]